jgi:hypothetical protein
MASIKTSTYTQTDLSDVRAIVSACLAVHATQAPVEITFTSGAQIVVGPDGSMIIGHL